MKKLMIAAAAAALVGGAFAIESANIVGYQDKVLRTQKQMITPTFQVVNGERGVWLSDLIPSGYEMNCAYALYGESIQFNIQIRDSLGKIAKLDDGKTPKSYTYTPEFDGERFDSDWNYGEDPEGLTHIPEYWLPTPWYDGAGKQIIPHGSNDLWLPAGTGLWFDAPGKSENDPEAIYKLTFSGQVNEGDCPVVLRTQKNPTGNPFPTGIRLSSIIPTGFDYNAAYALYGESIQFNIQILDSLGKIAKLADGKTPKSYTYTPEFDGERYDADWNYGEDERGLEHVPEYWLTTAWYDGAGKPVVAGAENDIVFEAGEGLWFDCPNHSDSEFDTAPYVVTFRFPTAK